MFWGQEGVFAKSTGARWQRSLLIMNIHSNFLFFPISVWHFKVITDKELKKPPLLGFQKYLNSFLRLSCNPFPELKKGSHFPLLLLTQEWNTSYSLISSFGPAAQCWKPSLLTFCSSWISISQQSLKCMLTSTIFVSCMQYEVVLGHNKSIIFYNIRFVLSLG